MSVPLQLAQVPFLTSTGTVSPPWLLYLIGMNDGQVSASGTLTANQIIVGAGSSTIAALGSLGTTTTVLHGDASGPPTFGSVSLTADVTGILPVANGGSGTTTAFTRGSVIFAGASGVYAQDNAHLFYDSTANSLVIGNSSAIVGASSQTEIFQVVGTSGASVSQAFHRYSADSSPPNFRFYKSRGASIGTETVVQNGDIVGRVLGYGYDSAEYRTPGYMEVFVQDSSVGANKMGGGLRFLTTTAGTITTATRAELSELGLLLYGATSGYVGLIPPAAPTSWTLTLPTTAGTANYPLITNGSGVASWTILPSAGGGTGVANAGTITNASNTTITGGGTLALGGFTLTVPATGTAVLTTTDQSIAGVKTFTTNLNSTTSTNQNDSGGFGTQYSFSKINITDSADVGTDFQNGFAVIQAFNSASVKGGRVAGLFNLTAGTTNAANSNLNNVGLQSNIYTAGDANHSGTTSYYSFGAIASQTAGATNNITGLEINVVLSGGTTNYKSGLQIASGGADAVQGTVDAAISVSAIAGGSVGWKNGLLFSAVNGQQPMGSSGVLIATSGSSSIAGGIDFSSYTFSAPAIKTPKLSIDDSANSAFISFVSSSFSWATSALGTHAGQIKILIDGNTYWMAVYNT